MSAGPPPDDLNEPELEPLDLTRLEPATPPVLLAAATVEPYDKPYDPEPHREGIRGYLAMVLMGVLILLLVATFIGLALEWYTAAEMDTILTIVFSPVVTLIGTVLGFYYAGGKGK